MAHRSSHAKPDAFKVLLASVAPGAEDAVGAAISKVLGVDDFIASELAKGAPLVILDGLARNQAMAIVSAMQDVSEAGATLEVIDRVDETMGQLGWSKPPLIDGDPLDVFRSGG